MNKFYIYNLGGSCCSRSITTYFGDKIFVKEIEKNIQGIENGYEKFFFEIQHMKKYQDTNLYPKIIYEVDNEKTYSVGLEFCYNGITLSDLLRNETVPMNYYQQSFEFIIKSLISRLYLTERYDREKDYLQICYFDRIKRRMNRAVGMLNKYGFSDCIEKILHKGCIINNLRFAPLYKYIDYISSDKELIRTLDIRFATPCHYDLCPCNILVNMDLEKERISDFKLIDVRGEGETGKNRRHFMYDMGKMLLGIDTFDIFRIFNNGSTYKLLTDYSNEIPEFQFHFIEGSIYKRYENAYNFFWEFMERNNYFESEFEENESSLRLKFLFSQSMMYHPDIPCRMIYEKDEELAILMYLRGMMFIKKLMIEIYNYDPLVDSDSNIPLWPIVKGE